MNNNQNIDIDEIEEELFEHFRFDVPKGQLLLRIDKFLMNLIPNATRNKIQNAATAGDIYVNDVPVKSNYRVKPLDVVRIMLTHPPFENRVDPENIPLDIVYEDDTLLLINKPAGFVVHPGHGNYTGTLVNALAYHFDNLPMNSSERPGLVHRIDKDTTGLLVIAKTEAAMTHLAKQFEAKTSEREYVAMVWGTVKEDEGTIEGNIARHVKDRMQMSVFEDPTIGKHAVTHYKVLERFGYVTLVSCILETGRTHQIRVHMASQKMPLLGDTVYGGTLTPFIGRQALHAEQLAFEHPVTHESMSFKSPLPHDFTKLLEARSLSYNEKV
jgi:23S rRNA pseudouridine1911/1915/1917 synthase